MKKFPLSSRRLTITALLFVVALLVSVGSYSFFATTRKANASAAFIPHPIFVNPQYSDAGVPDASGTFLCQTPAYVVHCYGPKQFQNAYAVESLLDEGIQGQAAEG